MIWNKYLVLAFIGYALEDKEEIMFSAINVGRLGFVHGKVYLGKASSRILRNRNYSVGFTFGVIGGEIY